MLLLVRRILLGIGCLCYLLTYRILRSPALYFEKGEARERKDKQSDEKPFQRNAISSEIGNGRLTVHIEQSVSGK